MSGTKSTTPADKLSADEQRVADEQAARDAEQAAALEQLERDKAKQAKRDQEAEAKSAGDASPVEPTDTTPDPLEDAPADRGAFEAFVAELPDPLNNPLGEPARVRVGLE